jgi:hypothetical protein
MVSAPNATVEDSDGSVLDRTVLTAQKPLPAGNALSVRNRLLA